MISMLDGGVDPTALGATLPKNIELEQSLLGAILVNNDAWLNVGHILEPTDFSDPLHGRIYNAICRRLSEEGGRATPSTLKPMFTDEPDITDDLSVSQYLGVLAANATTIVNVPFYAADLKDLSRRRELIHASAEFISNASNPNHDLTEACSAHIAELDDALVGNGADSTRATVAGAADTVLETLKENSEAEQCCPTGLIDLDRVLGGWYRGEFTILAGRPSMGKTALAVSSLLHLSERGYGVHYQSAEMTNEALAQRCLSDLVWNRDRPIPYVNIRRRKVDGFEIERLQKAKERLDKADLVIDDKPSPTLAEVGARARAQKARFEREGKRLDVLCVDHMGKLKPSGRYAGNKVAETGEISAGLAALAKELDCAVIGLCQLSRQVEARERKSKRPELSDLRYSGDLEQDADVVIFVYRAAYYLERLQFDDDEKERERLDMLEVKKNEIEMIIAKQRSGYTTTVTGFCEMGSNVIRDRQ